MEHKALNPLQENAETDARMITNGHLNVGVKYTQFTTTFLTEAFLEFGIL